MELSLKSLITSCRNNIENGKITNNKFLPNHLTDQYFKKKFK